MLTVAKAFGFCLVLGAFEETVSWTIDLPHVRKYFFEQSLEEKSQIPDKVVYDNVHTKSRHFDYEKYREHYADEYQYHGYMEQKVHNAVRNGSAYLEGLRRAIEAYTRRLEDCRRLNFTTNIIQLRPDVSLQNLSDPTFPSLNASNFNLPTNFSFNMPPNATTISSLSMNFTQFMRMSTNYTLFNISDGLTECMRADLASEHVRRLAELAIWAANELQDKLYRDRYEQHDDHHHYDDTLILRLAWFLDRLAHLTGYDPRPEDFVESEKTVPPSPTPPMLSFIPVMISNEQMRFLRDCMNSSSPEPATERCRFRPRSGAAGNPDTLMRRGYPDPAVLRPDLQFSMSENHEYVYTEQDYAEENMPLSLPPKPLTAVKPKRKRSVQVDPLQNMLNYYTKYKAWTGSNQEIKENSGEITNNELPTPIQRVKRFIIIKKKGKHFKIENPMPNLSSIVKHKFETHLKKDKDEAIKIRHFFGKLNVLPVIGNKDKLKKKKVRRSASYRQKYQPRIPADPQGDISYYIKNKKGTNYDYNAAQALLVRAGLEQAFQTGNIEVVRRYGSNYNPANTMQILNGFSASTLLDV